MTREQFLAYLDDYNAGDETRLVSHFDADVIFENFGDHHRGADVIAFLGYLNGVVRSRMTPLVILVDGNDIALEADTELLALQDLPNLPIGAMRKGDRMIARTFAFYKTAGPIIQHLRISGWPPRPASDG